MIIRHNVCGLTRKDRKKNREICKKTICADCKHSILIEYEIKKTKILGEQKNEL